MTTTPFNDHAFFPDHPPQFAPHPTNQPPVPAPGSTWLEVPGSAPFGQPAPQPPSLLESAAARRLDEMGIPAVPETIRAYELARGDAAREELERLKAQPDLIAEARTGVERGWQERFDEELREALAVARKEQAAAYRVAANDLLLAVQDADRYLAESTSAAGVRHVMNVAAEGLSKTLDPE